MKTPFACCHTAADLHHIEAVSLFQLLETTMLAEKPPDEPKAAALNPGCVSFISGAVKNRQPKAEDTNLGLI